MSEPTTEPTLDQQIARAASAYTKARRSGDQEQIDATYAELQRLIALRDG